MPQGRWFLDDAQPGQLVGMLSNVPAHLHDVVHVALGVRPSRDRQAHEVQRRIPQRRPGFDRRIGKSVGMKSADAVEVDVHRTLATGGLGASIPLDRLFDRPETFQLAGTPIRALARHHRALHAAYHSVIHTPVPDLRSIRDLGAHLADSDHDLSPLISEAQRWRGTTVLRQAVEATLEMLPIDVPGWRAWVDTTEPDPRDLVLVQRTWQLDTALVDRGLLTELGLLDRMRYLVAVAAPSEGEYVTRLNQELQNSLAELQRRTQEYEVEHTTRLGVRGDRLHAAAAGFLDVWVAVHPEEVGDDG